MQRFLLGFDLLDEFLDRLFRRHVGRDGDDLAWDVLRVQLDDFLKLFGRAPGNVHFGTVDGQCLRGHQSDARATTGDQGHWTESVVLKTVWGLPHTSALDIKHVFKGESLISLFGVHFVEQLWLLDILALCDINSDRE